jgi:fructokinase
MDCVNDGRLDRQVEQQGGIRPSALGRIVAIGEVLWDIIDGAEKLGGAPLNFLAHANRLGFGGILISAVGQDHLGVKALDSIAALGLDTRFVQTTSEWPTGTAAVQIDPSGQPSFTIQRPAAYDATQMADRQLCDLAAWDPGWLYYGTLFGFGPRPRHTLARLMSSLPQARRFYDVNLRPASCTPLLVCELLEKADVVKVNESELEVIRKLCDLPTSTIEAFCREGAARFGWQAVCVTLGEQGCAVFADDQYEEADGFTVKVADPVGAGDAFAAAFLHGLTQKWPPSEIASFSNRVGAIVASRPGAIPDWSMDEVLSMTRSATQA